METKNGDNDTLVESSDVTSFPGDEINADGMEMEENESLVSHFDGVDPSMIERLHVCYIANQKGYFKKQRS